ncbi:MAG: thioredoxin family protein [Myxococcota bacterium]
MIEAEHVTGTQVLELVEAPDVLTVVEFWGHDCPNCDVFAAAQSDLLEALGDVPVRFLKVNAYDDPTLATEWAIHGIPTFFLYRAGERLGRMTSFKGKEYWLAVVRDHLPSSAVPSTK